MIAQNMPYTEDTNIKLITEKNIGWSNSNATVNFVGSPKFRTIPQRRLCGCSREVINTNLVSLKSSNVAHCQIF